MEHTSKLHPKPSPQKIDDEWPKMTSLIKGISNQEYLTRLHEARRLDENFVAEFRNSLSVLSPDNQSDYEVKAIREFFYDKLNSDEKLSVQQMATILYELKDRGDDEGVVQVSESGLRSRNTSCLPDLFFLENLLLEKAPIFPSGL